MSKRISVICITLLMASACDEAGLLEAERASIEAVGVDEDIRSAGLAAHEEIEDGAEAGLIHEASDELVDDVDPAAASCVGYYNGGNFCLASCWDNPGHWVAVGHITNTAYGQCGSAVDQYCAWHSGTYGACWGTP